jgi:hypothetical protein
MREVQAALVEGSRNDLLIAFPPLRAPQGAFVPTSTLQLELTLLNAAPDAHLALQASVPSDNAAFIAVVPRYRQHLIDPIWPISTLAEGQSGVFGWAPLYLLLPMGFFVCLLAALERLSRLLAMSDG